MQAEQKGKIAPEILCGRLLAPLQGVGHWHRCSLRLCEPYFFLHKKADPQRQIGFILQGHKTDPYIEVRRWAE